MMKKRLLVILLAICMVMTMTPAMSFADDEQTTNSTGSPAEELLGLDGKIPNEYTKAEATSDDGDNPMGLKSGEIRQLVVKNELYIGIHDGEPSGDQGETSYNTIYGRDSGSIDWNKHEAGTSIGGATDVKYSHVVGSFVQAVPVNVLGHNKDDAVAYVYVTEDQELYAACDYYADGALDQVTLLSDSEPFLDLGNDLDQWWAKNMMAITAGDYNGDGKDEVAIGYNTTVSGKGQGIRIKVLSFGGDRTKPATQLCTDYFTATGSGTGNGDYSSIDLASGDFNNDGLDDIAAIQYRGRTTSKDASRTRLYVFTGTTNSSRILSSPGRSYASTTADYDFYGPSIDAGDVNGDGVEDIVVAGYEVTYNDDNKPVYDEENVRVVVYRVREGSTSIQSRAAYTTPMNGFAKGGVYSSADDAWSKVALACVATNGKKAPEQLFLDGYLCAIVGTELSTVYAPQYFGSSDHGVTDPDGESHSIKNAFIETAVAGVFDGNEAGREQVAFSVALKIESRDDYYYESGIIGGRRYEDEKDSDGRIASYGTCTDYFSNYFEEEYVNPDGRVMLDAGDDLEYAMYYTMVPVDIDDDGLYATYEGMNYAYSDPHVDAVLQAAPYFGDLIGDGAPYCGETAYEVTKTYTMEKTSSDNVSFGVTVTSGIQAGADVGVANLTISQSLEAGYQMEWTQTFTDSLTTSYTQSFTADSYDTVLIQRTPSLVYTYKLAGSSDSDDTNAEYITYSIPQGPIYYQMSIDEYNDFVDIYNAKIDTLNVSTLSDAQKRQMVKLIKIDDEYLDENEGDPSKYRPDWADDDHNAVNLSQSDLTLGYNSGTATNTWTTESAYSEGVEMEHGFHYGLSTEFEGGLLGNGPSLGFGFSLDYKHGTGTCETTANEKSCSGTVTNIDPEDMEQWGYDETTYRAFGFKWSFGKWDITSSEPICTTVADPDDEDEIWWTEERIKDNCNTPVFGYAVTNVTRPAVAPYKLKVQTSELSGTDSMDLSWLVPSNLDTSQILGYHVAIVDEDGKYNVIEDLLIPANVTEYTLSGLESDTEYTLAICAVTPDPADIHNKTINGLWSNTGTDRTDKKQYTVTLVYNDRHVTGVEVTYLGNIPIASGDKVPEKSLISGKATAKDGYAIKAIKVTYTDEDGNEVVIPDAVLTDLSFYFALKGDTVIEITDGDAVKDGCNITTSVSETDGVPDGALQGTVDGYEFDVEGANVDGEITLTAEPAEGFVLDKWEIYEALVTGEPVGEPVASFGNDGSEAYTFVPYMDNTHVKAVFAKADDPAILRTITVKESEGGTLIVKDKDGNALTPDENGNVQVPKATKVTVTYETEKSYTLKEWTDYVAAYDADVDEIEIVVMEDFTIGARFKAPIRFNVYREYEFQDDEDGNPSGGTITAADQDGTELVFTEDRVAVLPDTTLTFSAEAEEGSRIVSWTAFQGSAIYDMGEYNDRLVTSVEEEVPVTANTRFLVVFRNIDEFDISVTAKNSTVTITDAEGNQYADGDEASVFTVLKISAEPDPECTMTSISVNGEEIRNGGTVTVQSDIVIESIAKKPDHTIKFDPNGGAGEMEDVVVNEDDPPYILPECGFTAPEGMYFDGWDKGYSGDPIQVVDDMTITAQWKAIETKYTISFDGNGGTGSMDPVTVYAGSKYILPENGFTAPEGKVFAGWDKGDPGSEIDVKGDMTITAQWKDEVIPVTYVVKYEANGGTGTMEDDIVTAGEKLTLPECGFTASEGTTFAGWDKGVPGDEVEITGDTTVTAQWRSAEDPVDPETYTVCYEANGGTGAMENDIVTAGEKLTLPECGFTAPEGKVFAGWDKGDPGSEIDVKGDMTITAQWKDEVIPVTYVVKYDANGGTGAMENDIVTAGEKLTLPECGFTAPEGKTFDGWDLGAPGDEVDIAADTTVTAQWRSTDEAVEYTVSFDANGGTGTMDPVAVPGGKEYTLPLCEFMMSGSTFTGWDKGQPAETIVIEGNTVLTAQWSGDEQYTVKFDANGGTGTMDAITVRVGEKLELPANGFTAPDGKVFEKWDIGKAGETVDVNADMTAVAVWKDASEALRFTIKFDPNGGIGTMADITLTEGDNYTLPANAFQPPYSKKFDAWDLGAPGKVITVSDDITITAQWINDENVPDAEHLRVFGKDRYETAFMAADLFMDYEGITQMDAVIVADGTNYADALSGSCLSAAVRAPILLIRPSKETEVKEYIVTGVVPEGTVYLLGGTGAVSEAFETAVSDAGFNVVRLGGSNRYETNIEILKEVEARGGKTDDMLVCSGKNFPDALSISSSGRAVLLVGDSLTDGQKAYLEESRPENIYIEGGEAAVSNTVEEQMAEYGTIKKRLAGSNRYETSRLVAEEFFGGKRNTAVLVYGMDFPDGLSGGAVATIIGAPVLLCTNSNTAEAAAWVKNAGAVKSITLGGPSLVSDAGIAKVMGKDSVDVTVYGE